MNLSRKVYESKPAEEMFLVRGIEEGAVINGISPQFVTEPLYSAENGHRLIRPANPGLSLLDEKTGKRFRAFIKGLNEREVEKISAYFLNPNGEKAPEFDVVVRRIKNDNSIIYLEQKVREGNKVHVIAIKNARSPEQLYGRFVGYNVFIYRQFEDFKEEVHKGDFVFGRVLDVDSTDRSFRLKPISIIPESRYEKYGNMVF